MKSSAYDVIAVTLNPAIDQTLTISNFTAGVVNRVGRVRSNPGGKGVNVAVALADYNHRVAVTGFLGKENSASFETLFSEKGIEDRFVRVPGQTRVSIKISDPALHQTTDINFPGLAPTADDLETLDERLASLDAFWIILGGSLPPEVEPSTYARLVGALKKEGCKIALDTSGEPLRQALASKPDLIKPNIHELEALLGRSLSGESEVIEAARELVSQGIELVVVSMGREGACFVSAEQTVVARPPDVEVQSTVGAGDAMVAGIVAARMRHYSLEECARLATAFSLNALSRSSPQKSARDAIKSYSDQVVIK